MPPVAEEQVLVVPTHVLTTLGAFNGFSGEIDRYLPAILESPEISYRPRGQMEEDPSFKQLIPYVLFRYAEAGGSVRLFSYQRGASGGERRLVAKRSVGVGGHISTEDAQRSAATGASVYREGLARELAEEVRIDTPYRETVVGLINDEETPVGRVHLGVVHLFDVESPGVSPNESSLADARFVPVEEILAELDHYESWSQIAMRALFA